MKSRKHQAHTGNIHLLKEREFTGSESRGLKGQCLFSSDALLSVAALCMEEAVSGRETKILF